MLKLILNLSIAVGCTIGSFVIVIAWFLLSTPRPTNVKSCFTTEMYHVRLCPDESNYVRLVQISTNMQNAVIASEDTTFWQHKGIDYHELQKSLEKNWREGKFARGGSTITQQLAKNLYLTGEKSLFRKLREALIAVQLEEVLTKKEILEKYLNVVEFGENIYGVKQAAQTYFNKSPSQLTAVDSAFLAFLLPNPKKYSESFRKKQLTPFARREIKNILVKLHWFKKLSDGDYQAAIAQVDHMWSNAPAMEGEEEQADSREADLPPPAEPIQMEVAPTNTQEPEPSAQPDTSSEIQKELNEATQASPQPEPNEEQQLEEQQEPSR